MTSKNPGNTVPLNQIQRRATTLIGQIERGERDYSSLVAEILKTDLKFWAHEQPTLDRYVYFMLNQLLDILNLERSKKYHQIPYELADLFSMSIGYMLLYGDPYLFVKERVNLNHNVKTEQAIAEKYERRYQKYGKITHSFLCQILQLHEDEAYFQSLTKKQP